MRLYALVKKELDGDRVLVDSGKTTTARRFELASDSAAYENNEKPPLLKLSAPITQRRSSMRRTLWYVDEIRWQWNSYRD